MSSDFVRYVREIEAIDTASAKVPRTLNSQRQTEPTSADEVLA
jgi:hypothetical protein